METIYIDYPDNIDTYEFTITFESHNHWTKWIEVADTLEECLDIIIKKELDLK